jgi:hypothetical protein
MSTKQNKNVTFSNTEPKVDFTWHGTVHEENFPGTTELKENFRSSGTAIAGQEAQRQFERAQQRFGQTSDISQINFIAPPDGDVALNTFTNSMNTSPYQVYDEKLEHELASQYGYNRGGVYRKTKRNQKRRKNKTTKKTKKTKRNRMTKRRHIKYTPLKI